MNKITLKYELDLNFKLIAINCPLKDYRFCFFVNKYTHLDLAKVDDHETWIPKQSSLFFSKYSYINPVQDTEFYLIGNKGIDGGYLIPEMRSIDYFLLIKEYIDEEDFNQIIEVLNQIDDVVVAKEIDPAKLKSKENLLF